MDLLEFVDPELYFDSALPQRVGELLLVASREYGSPAALHALDEATRIAPESLAVLVALYRYHYYQHDLEAARAVGYRAAQVAASELGYSAVELVHEAVFQQAFQRDPGGARFYLQALKGIGFLSLRLGDFQTAEAELRKVVELDERDHLGCRGLLQMAEMNLAGVAMPESDDEEGMMHHG